jgi:hypothetical protein
VRSAMTCSTWDEECGSRGSRLVPDPSGRDSLRRPILFALAFPPGLLIVRLSFRRNNRGCLGSHAEAGITAMVKAGARAGGYAGEGGGLGIGLSIPQMTITTPRGRSKTAEESCRTNAAHAVALAGMRMDNSELQSRPALIPMRTYAHRRWGNS